MALVRLIYASTVADAFRGAEIDRVLTQSRTNNEKNYISGILWFDRHYFVQALEGSSEAVNTTYLKISQDVRHSSVRLLDYRAISKREFSGWSMGYVAEMEESRAVLLAYLAHPKFNPYELSGISANEFLISLGQYLVTE